MKKTGIKGGEHVGEMCSQIANMGISKRFSQENITKIKLGKKS